MRQLLTILALTLITGVGAFGQAEPENPAPVEPTAAEAAHLQELQATVAKLQYLLAIKEWAGRGKAMQAKAEWAAQGKAMQAKAEWAAHGHAMQHWQPAMQWYGDNATAIAPLRFQASVHPYSPLGLILRKIDAAAAAGDTPAADQLLKQALKVQARNPPPPP
jgi:hypothetical protein